MSNKFVPSFDLLLKNGRVIDPVNEIDDDLDVGISGTIIGAVEKSIDPSRSKKTINQAKKLKLGNFYTSNLKESVKNSDLIIICTPLSTYKKILDKKIKITSTCVRIPVLVSHSISANVEFEKKN